MAPIKSNERNAEFDPSFKSVKVGNTWFQIIMKIKLSSDHNRSERELCKKKKGRDAKKTETEEDEW